jgi:hypothetical protein
MIVSPRPSPSVSASGTQICGMNDGPQRPPRAPSIVACEVGMLTWLALGVKTSVAIMLMLPAIWIMSALPSRLLSIMVPVPRAWTWLLSLSA